VRTTGAAVFVVGIALVIAAITTVFVLRERLTADVRDSARLRASEVTAALEGGTQVREVVRGGGDDVLVQVFDVRGRSLASSPSLSGLGPLTDAAPGHTAIVHLPDDDERFLATVARTRRAAGSDLVVVARTLETVSESTRLVSLLFVFAIPVLLCVVGITTWLVVGRALRPVDTMRSEVDAISASALHRRVPDTGGHDEISRLATTMNRMLDRLEHAQRRQQQFVSDASHELRSPVASIRELAEVALAHPDRTTTAALAQDVLAEDLRVQRLVDDLLVLARTDEQLPELRRRAVDLDDLVYAEARRLRANREHRVDTSAVRAERVLGDASMLRRVVANLGDNANRHARDVVVFTLTHENGHVVLAVDDDGNGIPRAERERVFERFVRLDDARTRDSGGSGLGLAIVAGVVAVHGGSVQIVERVSQGTRVEVRLPAAPESTG
jgi:signal transduction histidine kinase